MDEHARSEALRRHRLAELVLPPTGLLDDFDGAATECPKVFRFRDRWYMTYTGITKRDDHVVTSIGLATSDDLLHWTRLGQILAPTGEDTFDARSVSAPFPYVDGDTVQLYFAGFPGQGYEAGASCIGRATSSDLKTWHRDPANPILRPDPTGGWNDVKLYQSFLLRHDGIYYLFYNAYGSANACEQIGLATSSDLRIWHPHPASPVLRQGDAVVSRDNRIIADPWIVRMDNEWWMHYFGFDGIHARDYVATSDDLIHWTKRIEWGPTLDVGPEGSYDCIHAHKPCVLLHQGVWYHFYTAVGAGEQGAERRAIALATSRRLPGVAYRE